jgi:hypothetical protein
MDEDSADPPAPFPELSEESKKDPRVAVISAFHDAYLEAAARHDWILCDILRAEIRKIVDGKVAPWFSIKIEDLKYKR